MKIFKKNFSLFPNSPKTINTDILCKNYSLLFSEIENEELSNIRKQNEEDYSKLISAIKNLPPHFNNCRETIFEALDKYSISQNLLESYEHEYFYKKGVQDSLNLFVNEQKNK